MPTSCPKCGSSDIDADRLDLDGDFGYGDVKCHSCGFVWNERWACQSWESKDPELKGETLFFQIEPKTQVELNRVLVTLWKQEGTRDVDAGETEAEFTKSGEKAVANRTMDQRISDLVDWADLNLED